MDGQIYLDIEIPYLSIVLEVSMSRDMLRSMGRKGRSVSDEVDDIVARWRTERPDLDVAPMQVLSRVSRLARHLDRARRAAFAAHGLEAWEFDVLSALRRQGAPYQLSPGALLRATLVTSGTMTNRIDRLEARGLVRRQLDPQDKRGVLVELTSDGMRGVDAAVAALLERERELLAELAADQQEELAGLLRVLLAPFDTGPVSAGPVSTESTSTGRTSTGPATTGAPTPS
jgi:DNA-binding MarR family transcriptional regulator